MYATGGEYNGSGKIQEAKDKIQQFLFSLQPSQVTFHPTVGPDLGKSRLEDFTLLDILGKYSVSTTRGNSSSNL